MLGMAYPQPRHRHDRAHVRHQFERAKARGKRQCIRWYRRDWFEEDGDGVGWHWTPQGRARAIGRAATDRVPCSCWMCGNRRRWVGPKLQEIRQEMTERQEDYDVEHPWANWGKYDNDDEPDGWRDHPSFIDPLRNVPECRIAS